MKNIDLSNKSAFLLPHAASKFKNDALNISYTNPWSDINQACNVKRGESVAMPSGCEYGIRETYYYANGKVGVRITGVDTVGNLSTWSAFYDNTKNWTGWNKDVKGVDITTNAQFLQDIPHTNKIQIPFGGCQSIVGCLFDRVVILNAYFQIKEDIPVGGAIFNLPQTYRPQHSTIAIGFVDHATQNVKYYGGINKNGVIYPDMSIPAGTALVVNASFFKY